MKRRCPRPDSCVDVHAELWLFAGANQNLLGLVFTDGEVVAANFDFDGIAQGCEADELDGSADQETHFQKPTALFRRDAHFRNGGGRTCRERGEGTVFGHTHATGSTRMASASSGLIPRRALQTWQMKWAWRRTSLICCSSQKPSSRSRLVISGEVASCLIRTEVPALI